MNRSGIQHPGVMSRERELACGWPAHFLVAKATPNVVQPLKGHWLKEVPDQTWEDLFIDMGRPPPSFLLLEKCTININITVFWIYSLPSITWIKRWGFKEGRILITNIKGDLGFVIFHWPEFLHTQEVTDSSINYISYPLPQQHGYILFSGLLSSNLTLINQQAEK